MLDFSLLRVMLDPADTVSNYANLTLTFKRVDKITPQDIQILLRLLKRFPTATIALVAIHQELVVYIKKSLDPEYHSRIIVLMQGKEIPLTAF